MVSNNYQNLDIINELEIILKQNSINSLISFYKKNNNRLFFQKETFYDACSYNNINIIKFIYNKLHNKKINFINALNYSCNQYNIKLFNWLSKIYNFNINDYYNCLIFCIHYDNIKLFKFLKKKFNLDLFKNNYELILFSIKNNNLNFLKYLLNLKKNIIFNFNLELIQFTLYSNNINIINLIINKLNKFNLDNNHLIIFDNCFKNSYINSIKIFLDFNLFLSIFKNNIHKYILYSFESNDINLIKYILSFNYHNSLNYDFYYDTFLLKGNLDIISLLYELNPNIPFLNKFSLNTIFLKKYYNIFKFILNNKIKFDRYNIRDIEIIFNKYYFDIIINLDLDALKLFLDIIKNLYINIYDRNILYSCNYLLSKNQIPKIDLIKIFFINKNIFYKDYLIIDSIKSKNINCVKYALNLIYNNNININSIDFNNIHKNEILYYSYLYGLEDFINEFDSNNQYNILSYRLILINNIKNNNYNIINKIINKNNFDFYIIDNDILHILIKYSSLDVFNLFFNNIIYKNINIYLFIDYCILYNNFQIIQLFNNIFDYKSNLTNDLFLKICKNGNLNFIKWYLDFNLNIDNFINTFFDNLIFNKHYEQAIFFYNYKDNSKKIKLNNDNFKKLKDIITYDNFDMFKWYIKQFNEENKIQLKIFIELNNNILDIIKNDNTYILDFIINELNLKYYNLIKKIYELSFSNYYSNILKYLSTNFNLLNYKLDCDFKNIFIHSVKFKYFDIIDIIITNFDNYDWLYIVNCNYYSYDIISYLMINYYDYLKINEESFYNIFYLGNLDNIKKYIKYNKEKIDYSLIDQYDLSILIVYNDIELLDFIYNLNSININLDDNEYFLETIIRLNKINILKWFFDNFTIENLHLNNNYIYYYAIINQNLEILDLLFDNDNIIYFDKHKFFYLKISTFCDNINIFIWFETKFNNLNYDTDNNILLLNSVYNNNINLLIYLLNKFNFDINFNDSIIIRSAFNFNYYDMIKYLFKKYDNINVLVKNQIIMKYAIEDGDLDIIQLLYDYNNNFDLSIDNEYLFRTSCKTNNIDVTKWLIYTKKNINYSINNHEIFYFICEQNYYDIALFFQELNPNLYQVIFKNNIIISYLVFKNLNIDNNINIDIHNIHDCPICYESKSQLITYCNHQFCENCLKNINNINKEFLCPLCRTKIISLKNII